MEPEVTGYVVEVVVGARVELGTGTVGLADTEEGCEHAVMRTPANRTTMTHALRRMDQNVLGIAIENREEPIVDPRR